MPRIKLTRDIIGALLDVDCESGSCTWKVPVRFHPEVLGRRAGCPRVGHKRPASTAYWVISIDGKQYKQAHIVFLVANGRWPKMIDHIDGNSLNDRASNLREVTPTQNAWNHRHRKKNAPVPMGVKVTPNGKFQARIACNKQTIHLGTFNTAAEAQRVYLNKRLELFGEFSGLQESYAAN